MLALLLSLFVAAAPAEGVDTVVVCPAEFRAALAPWVEHRQAQGHRLAFVDNRGGADEIRAAIRRLAAGGALRFVVLVGDADPAAATDARVAARSVPTHLAKARVNVHFGSDAQIATDNWYADLDDDALPDVAIGRLSADSPEELSRMVTKILRYEQAALPGRWRRQINLVAGVGGFGGMIDSVIEMSTKKFLTEGIPAAYRTSMTYGSWQSSYCPDPRRFHDVTVRRLNEGCLFWVYIGHGHPEQLDRVRTPAGGFHILDVGDAGKLRCESGSPIAIMLACYTGAFDRERDCLSEEMLRAESGPVAVLSGSRVTMPYAMSVMGSEMLRQYFQERRPTIGEVLLHAKREMVKPLGTKEAGGPRQWLDLLAATFSPRADLLDEERAEHVLLFNLLGDPLLRVAYPETVELATKSAARAGERIEISGECPIGGRLLVELVCRRDCTRQPAVQRTAFARTGEELSAFDRFYDEANNPQWTKREFRFEGGKFRVELDVPDDAYGPCHVCAEVVSDKRYALGAADVFIRRAATAAE
ncbi:MAG: C25 family cysteine peptidase [Pirellulaceae bacterium]